MQLTGKQKRQLRGLGHHLQPVIQIGKGGLTEALQQETERALETHELIKIKTLESCDEDTKNAAETLAEDCRAALVQVLGHTALIYRQRKENPSIKL